MTDHDPLGEAFGERRDAAEALDIDAGLAGVHRRNSLTHRAGLIGAGVAALALAVLGIGWFVGGDDEGTPVRTPPASTTEAPPTTDLAPTVVPTTTEPGPRLIVTDGSDEIWIDGARLGPPPEVEGPITDAVDDLAGGLVVETADAIWHLPPPGQPPVLVAEELDRGNIDLIDVAIDGTDAATKVIFTDWFDPDGPGTQVLYRQDLAPTVTPDAIAQIGGGEFAVTTGGAGGADDSDGSTLIAVIGSDGPCSQVLVVGTAGGLFDERPGKCIAEAHGLADIEELVRAVDLSHDGQLFVLDGTSLSHPDGRTLDLPGAGPSATLDLVEPWAVVLTARDGGGEAFLVDIDDGSIEALAEIPADPTSVRLARTAIDFGVRSPSTIVDDGQEVSVPAGEYRVVGVSFRDELNVRRGPGTEFTIEGGVPRGGIVTATGNARELTDGSVWYELAWPENQIAWANGAFLLPVSDVGTQEFECEGDESPDPGTTVVLGIDAPTGADVAGIEQSSFGHCVRTVIDVPGVDDVTVSEDGRSLIVRFPETVTDIAPGSDVEAGLAFVVRDEQFRPYVEILTGRLERFGARFDADAGQLVVDHAWATADGDPPPFPAMTGAGIVVRDTDLQIGDGGRWFLTDRPTAFNGFARPFEANISLEMLDDSGQPFEGVVWRSSEGDVTGSSTYTMTTDWATAWGTFSFQILDIPPGDYTLRLSGDGGSDTPRYLEIPFTAE